MPWYYEHLGLHKNTAMIFIGGDNFYTKLNGRMKDIKFYFKTIVSE